MKKYVQIEGISCRYCLDTITKELLKNPLIKKVKFKKNVALIDCDDTLTNKWIIKTINDLNYFTKEEYIFADDKKFNAKIRLKEFLFILLGLLLLFVLLEKLLGYNIFNVIPNIDTNITYGMLFVTGLLTSIHCVSMCGAINLLTVVNKNSKIKNKVWQNSVFYNLGRVLSYTLLGGLVGWLGSVFQVNHLFSGIIITLASLIMMLMSLNMLGLIDFHLPGWKFIKTKRPHNAFLVGLLNGFMPCGPLQAMQVYALSTASVWKGAFSMFLFSLGTVPLMLGVGLFYNIIKGKGRIWVNKVAAVLILLLSLMMLNRGLLTLNIDVTKFFSNDKNYQVAKIVDNTQVVSFDLSYNSYQDIKVKKGIPVKMIINVSEKYLTGCNNEILIPDFNIDKKLEIGENIIEFTPMESGLFTYTCWMQMLKNKIEVVD